MLSMMELPPMVQTFIDDREDQDEWSRSGSGEVANIRKIPTWERFGTEVRSWWFYREKSLGLSLDHVTDDEAEYKEDMKRFTGVDYVVTAEEEAPFKQILDKNKNTIHEDAYKDAIAGEVGAHPGYGDPKTLKEF